MRVTASILLLAGLVHGNQLDTVLHRYIPAAGCSCLTWTDAAAASAAPAGFWASKAAQTAAGSSCSMPANATRSLNYIPWCVCGGAKPAIKPCTAPLSVPEQINLVLAAADVVVVGFVTYEENLPAAPPVAVLGDIATLPSTGGLPGVAHWYITSHGGTAEVRNYTMNFVRFTGLKPRQRYYYKVRSGADAAVWSDAFSFRAPYGSDAAGPTRIAIYGDMGNSQYNNVGNLAEDCETGAIDAIMHMGDHAYNMGDTNDHRGDAYMNAFSAALANCPWIPVIGNHESTECPGDEVDESTHERYLNQTWGAAYGQNLSSTATSALGHLLTRGSLHGAGVHGSTPSGTSQWYSVDLGKIHLVALDLDPLLHNAAQQQAWLEQDLAAADANRAAVPWIIVTSHFPIHNTAFEAPGVANASAQWFLGDNGHERFATSGHDFVPCNESNGPDGSCKTVGAFLTSTTNFLDPLLTKYKVDVYDAGHVHSYDTTWPLIDGKVTAKSYVNPNGTVHITEGNGGVPGVAGTNSVHPCKSAFGRICGTGGAYGRFTAYNSSVLGYEHVENPTGNVSDAWAIVRTTA